MVVDREITKVNIDRVVFKYEIDCSFFSVMNFANGNVNIIGETVICRQ